MVRRRVGTSCALLLLININTMKQEGEEKIMRMYTYLKRQIMMGREVIVAITYERKLDFST